MGPSSDPDRDFDLSVFRPVPEQPPIVIPPIPSTRFRREPWGRYIVLFILTLFSTTQAGGLHYVSFTTAFSDRIPQIPIVSLLLHGLWYSVSILAILGCHELGHYYACRYYRVDSSRPYFLPVPFLLTGTLGAFIRIRAPIPGNMSPLMYAAREGKIDAARLLLDAGANVNEVDKNDISPLFMAISNNHPDMARFLIDKGANINAKDWYGRTPLFAAVEMRNADMDYRTFELLQSPEDRKAMLDFIKLLLEKGVDPNIQVTEVPPLRSWMYLLGGSLAWVDFTGQTPFLLASLSGDVSTMRLLLEYKADPKIATYGGTTPLMAASGVNWVFSQTYSEGEPALLEAVKLCVELGMDVNAKNSMGLTALMGAANRGSDSIIEYLVSKGAKLDAKDNVGRTPYNWAEGVFLATLAPVPKPTSMTLIQKLSAK